MKVIRDIKSIGEAKKLATSLRKTHTKVGVSSQPSDSGGYTGLFVITAKGEKVSK